MAFKNRRAWVNVRQIPRFEGNRLSTLGGVRGHTDTHTHTHTHTQTDTQRVYQL